MGLFVLSPKIWSHTPNGEMEMHLKFQEALSHYLDFSVEDSLPFVSVDFDTISNTPKFE